MRPATQKELLERIRDLSAENFVESEICCFGLEYSYGGTTHKECIKSYKAGFDKGAEEMAKMLAFKDAQIETLDNALIKIDWHIREMQNEKIISMKEMCRALKVISDALENFRIAGEKCT